MGVNTDLEFDKFCKVGRIPRNVLPASRHESKGESKKVKQSSRKDNHKLHNSEGVTEIIKFQNFRSISCKNLPSEDVELEYDEVVRRGSVCNPRERKFRPEILGGRKKIEFSRSSESPFSFSILESICCSDEEVEDEPMKQVCSVAVRDGKDGFLKFAERDSMENRELQCAEVNGPLNTGNVLKERDFLALSPFPSFKGSPKSRFSPFRKMFGPLVKSKSYRNPPSEAKLSGLSLTDMRAKTLRNSMSRGFSSEVSNVEALEFVPVGNLKMEQKHGVPYFEFSMARSEDVYVAKSWKVEDALNWVYTFHSVQGRKKSNATSRGTKYRNKDFQMVGQMQVKRCLCSELNSMMTEFVLYDIDHARKSLEKARIPMTSALDRISTHFSSPYPLSMTDLHPRHEIAGVVVQVPLGNRDSKKMMRVNVVIPPGYHTLPNGDEISGPSSLIDRWRSGGGCDCGGWDEACPLVVFGISTNQCSKEGSLVEKSRPLKFYVEGGKENVPTLTITATEKGQYTVDFHAQLSPLQAFGICVSILHTSEASGLVEQEKSKKLLQCNTMNVLVEDEVKILMKTVTEPEKKKVAKSMEGNASAFVANPPFSPIARV